VPEVFGIVKKNLSGAQRRNAAASGERGAGKGAAALFPASALEKTAAFVGFVAAVVPTAEVQVRSDYDV
jgi:hypothetical protein